MSDLKECAGCRWLKNGECTNRMEPFLANECYSQMKKGRDGE
jgi:hypothetical protein